MSTTALTVGEAKAHVKHIEDMFNDPVALKERVQGAFQHFDTNKNGRIERGEAAKAVEELCKIMSLPVPTMDDMDVHFKALDQNTDGTLSEQELGGGMVAAFHYKMNALKHFLTFAERDKLDDDKPLPNA